MSKLLAAVFAALIVGVGVAAAGSLTASSDDPAHTGTDISTIESTGTTETTATTETGEDVSGRVTRRSTRTTHAVPAS